MNTRQNILFLDTSMAGCGAGLLTRGEAYVRQENMTRGQAEFIVPFAQEVMEQGNIAYKDLHAILVTYGPGAFTGIRICMSAARTFSLSHDIPIYGVTTLQAMAFSYLSQVADQKHNFGVIIETKRKDYYFQIFDVSGVPVSEAQSLDGVEIEAMPAMVIVGDAVARYEAQFPNTHHQFIKDLTLCDCESVLYAFEKGRSDEALFVCNPEPLYLRPPDVSMPKRKPRVISDQK